MKEYEFIYKKSLLEEIKYIFTEANLISDDDTIQETIKRTISSVSKEASVHFGQTYFNVATIAGMYRMMLKKIAKTYGVDFPKK